MSSEQKEQQPDPNVNDNLNCESRSGSESEREEGQEQQPEMQEGAEPPLQSSTRTAFTTLSQVDADLALARTLQEQERVYMMLRMNNDGGDYGSWDAGSYLHDDEDDDDFGNPHDHDDTDTDGDNAGGNEDEDEVEYDDTDGDEEDAFDVHAHGENGEEGDNNLSIEFDPAVFSSDEAYARALQEAEEREMASRLFALAGINDGGIVTLDDYGGSQDTWEEVDPDELSYEELLALGEVVGSESIGLSADSIATLPSVTYKTGSSQTLSNDSCVICRVDYEDGDSLTLLSCKHSYHPECINNWLKIKKVCPVCNSEVSTSAQS